MHYCISDVHGEYAMYLEMLKTINFSDDDVLFFIGDAADRGPFGVDVWKDIMSRRNVVMIRGNHEQMCLDVFRPKKPVPHPMDLWMYNGGRTTLESMEALDTKQREMILDYLQETPLDYTAIVDDKAYYFVHGRPGKSNQKKLWGRLTPECRSYRKETTIVVGHTPTFFLTYRFGPMQIWHGKGIIDIDCGCGHNNGDSQLACLRLEDMQEWYI